MKINKERIKYSPFGKRIMNGFKAEIILSVCTIPIGLLFCSFGLMAGSVTATVIMALIFLGVPALLVFATINSTLFEARLLSEMTEDEHNRMIAEYQKYEERNIIRYGHLTSYGIILADRILPWKNIREIRFMPGEYRRSGRHGYQYYPAKISVVAEFEKKRVVTTCGLGGEDYDLSDEIERFLESIPKYTEHKFAVDNGYYYAK